MSTMAENIIAAGADNRPPMLEKSQYNLWQSRMKLYIRGKEHGKDLLDSVLISPFKYETVVVPDTSTTLKTTIPITYDDLTDKEKIREECDIRAMNIVLQGLPPNVYTLVNHHIEAKEIWDKVKLLIEGTELSLQEQESKLYNEFDRFTSKKGLYAYLKKHEDHHYEVRMMRERFPNPLSLVANSYITPPYYNKHQPQYNTQSQYHLQLSPVAQQFYSPPPPQQSYDTLAHHQSYQPQVVYQTPVVHHQSYQAPSIPQQPQASFPQLDSGLVVPSFLPLDNPIASLNKEMTFISTTFALRYLSTNNQLITLSNPINQSTIQDGRVIVKVTWLGSALNQRGQRILNGLKRKCCLLLEPGSVLDEEQMAFLANNRDIVLIGQASQELTTTTILQTDDLDAFDSDCDEAPSASVVLMARLSTYDSDILSEYIEQPHFNTDSDIDITSGSNVISYEQYLKESKNAVIQDTTSPAQQDALIMSVIEEMSNQVAQFKKHDALSMIDTEETLKLAKESHLKMHAKQNDSITKEKKVNITPVDYAALNKLSKNFAKHFVPQKQLSAEQAFWLPISKPIAENPPVQ
ncbi:hypothetical protein Tco_1411131 [Tanacetum coccineum]